MHDATADQLGRIESKLDQVLALLTDDGVDAEDEEHVVEIVTMDGKRHSVSRSPNGTL